MCVFLSLNHSVSVAGRHWCEGEDLAQHRVSPVPVRIRASSYHPAPSSAFAPWCGSWRLHRERCWQRVRALCLSEMFACTRTVYGSSFSFSLKGARSEWGAKEQRLRETQPECCHFNSESSLLAGKPIDFPYCNAAKERTKILPGDSKRTQGSKVSRSVLRISYGGVIPTTPQAPTSSWLQEPCFCNALWSPCSSTAYGQLHSAEESSERKTWELTASMHRQHLHRMLLLVQDLCLTHPLHIPILGIGLPSAKWTGQAEFNTNFRNASAKKHSAGCQDVKQAGETCRNPSSDSIYFYDGRPQLTVLSSPKAQQDPNLYSLILEISVFTWG